MFCHKYTVTLNVKGMENSGIISSLIFRRPLNKFCYRKSASAPFSCQTFYPAMWNKEYVYVCTVCMCMYVCMYVCMCMYACMYVCMYLCMYLRMYSYVWLRLCVVSMYGYVCLYVCIDVLLIFFTVHNFTGPFRKAHRKMWRKSSSAYRDFGSIGREASCHHAVSTTRNNVNTCDVINKKVRKIIAMWLEHDKIKTISGLILILFHTKKIFQNFWRHTLSGGKKVTNLPRYNFKLTPPPPPLVFMAS